MALALGEDRDQHIGPGHFLTPGILDVDHGPLDHALEAGGRLGVLIVVDHQLAEFVVDIIRQRRPKLFEIKLACPHHPARILVIDKGKQQVLQRRVFMAALIGKAEGAVERVFESR